MATSLLHGTLHVTIYEGRNLVSDRLTGGAPAFFRKVSLTGSCTAVCHLCSVIFPACLSAFALVLV